MRSARDIAFLADNIDKALEEHVEKDHGLICGPDRLRERLIAAVANWLGHHERQYAAHDLPDEADILHDLSINQIHRPTR